MKKGVLIAVLPTSSFLASGDYSLKMPKVTGSLGLLPEAMERELMMGMKMPPALAVVEGMAGASSVSAALKPYARPRVLFPNSLTNIVATLSPKPVF